MTEFEHRFTRQIKALDKEPQQIVIAVSGGLDSMVLAHLFFKLSKLLKIEIAVAHIHHGTAETKQSQIFRDKAFEFVKAWVESSGVSFLTNGSLLNSKIILKSEAELRDFRHSYLEQLRREFSKSAFLALAQHRDDLLETRLIRLIRGTGAEGFGSMVLLKEHILRPLLGFSRSEIMDYARAEKIQWLEDPSNKSVDPLRNWMRQEWLPQLEEKRPGGSAAMGRSFELQEEELNAVLV